MAAYSTEAVITSRSLSQQVVVMCRHIAAPTPLMTIDDSLCETELATVLAIW